MNRTEVENKIKELLSEKISGSNLDNDELIFGVAGGLDSMKLLAFILEIEDVFDIMIADEDLIPENFSSVNCIVDYIIQSAAE